MMDLTGIKSTAGLTAQERMALEELVNVLITNDLRNTTIERYFEGDIPVRDIGVDVLPPDAKIDAKLSSDWAKKAVKSLAQLSRFDGFVMESGEVDPSLAAAQAVNAISPAYSRSVIGQLKSGCMFATVNASGIPGVPPSVRFHSATSASAIWDMGRERIAAGLVVADAKRMPYSQGRSIPVQVNMHLPGEVCVFKRYSLTSWVATRYLHHLDRPLMVSFSYSPTDTKPFGCSRISKSVRDLIDDVLRVRLALVVSTAFYAVPQKALLGLTKEQFNQLKGEKWTTYINSVLMTTRDKTGDVPQFMQLAANSPEALIRIIELDAKMFSGATGVPLNSLGVVMDNPSSAEAIAESRRELTLEAEYLNAANAESLKNLALLVMAVSQGVDIGRLSAEQLSVTARFRNPSLSSIPAMTDAAIKMAQVDKGFAGTDVFYEMTQYFSQDDIARVNAQKAANRSAEASSAAISAIFGGGIDADTA